MVVAAIVMLNILELIMEIVPNYPTIKNLIVGNFLNYQWLVLPMHGGRTSLPVCTLRGSSTKLSFG
jgi:hypothetical protein